MEQKYLKLLNEKYSNLGLSQEVKNSWAKHLAAKTDEQAEDSVLESNLKEIEPLLQATQAFGDMRATKALQDKNKTNEPSNNNPNPGNPTPPTDAPDWFKSYMEQQTKKENELREQLEALKDKQAQVSFDELVAKVGKELGLEGDMLDLAKAKLSSDMDETSVRTNLGATKEMLVKAGAIRTDNGAHYVSTETAMREEEKAWLDEKLKSQQQV